MDGVGCLQQPPNSAVPVDAGATETYVDLNEAQGVGLTSESILPCVAAVVGQPDPSKGPRESYEWLGNDLEVDRADVVGTDQLQHLLPVHLILRHSLDRHQLAENVLREISDDVELEEEEACQVWESMRGLKKGWMDGGGVCY